MKREERNLLNSLKKTVTDDTIVVEIPERFTHEARQAMHDLLTVEKHMTAECIGWNDIRKEYCIRYRPQYGRTNEQEGIDADTLLSTLPRSEWTWNGYKKPEAETADETKGDETTNTTEIITSTTATEAEKLAAIIRTFTTRRDPVTDAEKLLSNLGTIKTIIESPAETLAPVIGRAAADRLSTILPVIRMYRSLEMVDPQQIPNRHELEKYCLALTEGRQREGFFVIAVNAQCKVIAHKLISEGSTSEVGAYPREIARFALDVNAHSIFLCHNHPGGTCAPSKEDIKSTAQIKRMLSGLGILTLDHMITANGKAYSMAQHGDMPN